MMTNNNEIMPLVSIVIPTYNNAKYLACSIESVLRQDYKFIELIVIDDGSTDDTGNVLKKYNGMIYSERQSNMGQANALNRGWSLAKGEILSYVSADDALMRDAVTVAVDHLKNNNESVLVYGDYYLINEIGSVIRRVRTKNFNYFDLVGKIICQPGPGVFFKKMAFERTGGWDTSLRQIPDYEYWLRLGLIGKFLRIPKPLAKFRVHENSLSYAEPSVERSEECLRVISQYFRRLDVPDNVRSIKRQAYSNAHLVAARFHLRAGRYREFVANMRKACKWHFLSIFNFRTYHLMANGMLFRIKQKIQNTAKK